MDVELRDLNVLIGANGAGKSNFMEVFRLLENIVHGRLRVYVREMNGANFLLHYGRKVTGQITLVCNFDDAGYVALLRPDSQDALFFAAEMPSKLRDVEPPIMLGAEVGHQETKLLTSFQWQKVTNDRDIVTNRVVQILVSLRAYHFHDTSPEARIKQTQLLGDNADLHADGSNLAPCLYLIRQTHPQHYQQIVKTIRLAAPFFEDFYLRPVPENPDTIRLEWREQGWDTILNANMLSDGTLRFMCLVTLLLQPNLPSVILIDEPELGLHPYALNLLASLLHSAAAKTQVIITTQSTQLVNQFTPDDIIVVDRIDGATVCNRLSALELAEWLEDYSLGELWEKNVIGGRPRP